MLTLEVPLPGGTWELIETFIGKISEIVPRAAASFVSVDVTAIHDASFALDVGITKASGDETVLLGGTW
jgi:hypothetical protein